MPCPPYLVPATLGAQQWHEPANLLAFGSQEERAPAQRRQGKTACGSVKRRGQTEERLQSALQRKSRQTCMAAMTNCPACTHTASDFVGPWRTQFRLCLADHLPSGSAFDTSRFTTCSTLAGMPREAGTPLPLLARLGFHQSGWQLESASRTETGRRSQTYTTASRFASRQRESWLISSSSLRSPLRGGARCATHSGSPSRWLRNSAAQSSGQTSPRESDFACSA